MRVNIDTEQEAYPVTAITPAMEGSGRGYEVPDDLMAAYRHAATTLEYVERAVLLAAGFTDPADDGSWTPPDAQT